MNTGFKFTLHEDGEAIYSMIEDKILLSTANWATTEEIVQMMAEQNHDIIYFLARPADMV